MGIDKERQVCYTVSRKERNKMNAFFIITGLILVLLIVSIAIEDNLYRQGRRLERKFKEFDDKQESQ